MSQLSLICIGIMIHGRWPEIDLRKTRVMTVPFHQRHVVVPKPMSITHFAFDPDADAVFETHDVTITLEIVTMRGAQIRAGYSSEAYTLALALPEEEADGVT